MLITAVGKHKNNMFWEMIGITAATLTMFGFVPQVIKILRTKSAKDVSPITLIQFSLGTLLWTAYGLHLKDKIIVVANIFTLLTLLFAVILYIRFK